MRIDTIVLALTHINTLTSTNQHAYACVLIQSYTHINTLTSTNHALRLDFLNGTGNKLNMRRGYGL